MDSTYDVVVVGAGLGGLAAAALLAKKGYRVLTLERHNLPGGYATSFVRGRYEFEVSLHVLSDIGTPERPGGLRRLLEELGALDLVEFARVEHFSDSVFPDRRVLLPMDRQGFEAAIVGEFPESAKGVRRFLDRVMAVAEEADGLSAAFAQSSERRLRRLATVPLRLRAIPRYLTRTLGAILRHDVPDPGAAALLCQGWSYVGLPPSSCSFLMYAAMLGSLLNHGGWYPKTRSQGLSGALAEALRRHGGTLRLGCGAERILVEEGRVTGVVDERGERIGARMVISNAGPIVTYNDLVGGENVPDSARRSLRRHRVGTSIFQVYLGVARSARDLGLSAHEVLLNEDYDVESHYQRGHTLQRPGHMLIGCPNLARGALSEPGTSLVTLTSMVYAKPWLELEPSRYFEEKTRFAEGMLHWADQTFPGLRDHAEVCEVGTPLTMMRYAGHPGGAIYGFDSFVRSNTALRPSPVSKIRGLLFAGAWTNPGGGYWPAISSGQIAAEIAAPMLERGAA